MLAQPSDGECFTLCIDQIFVRTSTCPVKFPTLQIEIFSSGRFMKKNYDIYEISTPLKLDIEMYLPMFHNCHPCVHIDVFLDEILLSCFDFIISENIVDSKQQTTNGGETYVRIIYRAFTSDRGRFRIGTLREYHMSDFKDFQEIGRGSFGSVYRCEEISTQNIYALKYLGIPDIKELKDTSIREFLPFISIPHHPSMLEIYGYFFDQHSHLVLVLEFVSSGSIADLIKSKIKISDRHLLTLAYSTFHCLGFMHSYGFIHRDLSPENILVTDDYEAKVIDFSISRFDDSENLTKYQGKSEWMAPEVKEGDKYGKESDVYSASLIFDRFFEYGDYSDDLLPFDLMLYFNVDDMVNPCERINFNDMYTILDSLFPINWIERVKEETKYENNSFSSEILYDFPAWILSSFKLPKGENASFDVDYINIFLGFASELIKIGTNDDNMALNFDSLYQKLMMIGGIAFDLEMMTEPFDIFIPYYQYEKGRLFYRANTSVYHCSYSKSFLDFDVETGFHPTRNLEAKDFHFFLAFLYHVLKIVTIENESNNPIVDEVISILDGKDIHCLKKIIKCFKYIEKLNCLEALQSIFSALGDAGYVNMAVLAWKLYSKQIYGFKKTKKYLNLAIKYGDQESMYYLNNIFFEKESDFINYYNLLWVMNSVAKNDIPRAFYHFWNLYKNIPEIDLPDTEDIAVYYITLAFAMTLDEYESHDGYIIAVIRLLIDQKQLEIRDGKMYFKNINLDIAGKVACLYLILEFLIKLYIRHNLEDSGKIVEYFYLVIPCIFGPEFSLTETSDLIIDIGLNYIANVFGNHNTIK